MWLKQLMHYLQPNKQLLEAVQNNDVAELMSSGYFDEVIVTKSANINILKDSFNDYELLMLLGGNSGYSIYKEGILPWNIV